MNKSLGKHSIIDAEGCNNKYLDSISEIKKIIEDCGQKYNLHILEFKFHKFEPIGLSGFAILSESHIAIHTWPEYDFASIDIFTCGDSFNPEVAAEYIVEALEGKISQKHNLNRGF